MGLWMKKSVRYVLGCALLLFTPALAIAQMDALKNATPEERSAALTKMLQSNLTLDEKTTQKVSEIKLKYAQETQVLMDSSGPQLGKMMSFRKNAQAKDAQLKEVLAPQQYSLYEQEKLEMEATMKQKMMEKCKVSQ